MTGVLKVLVAPPDTWAVVGGQGPPGPASTVPGPEGPAGPVGGTIIYRASRADASYATGVTSFVSYSATLENVGGITLSSGVFTVPETATYALTLILNPTAAWGTTNTASGSLARGGATVFLNQVTLQNTSVQATASWVIQLAADDTVQFSWTNNSAGAVTMAIEAQICKVDGTGSAGPEGPEGPAGPPGALGGSAAVTTDASGNVNITHGLGRTPVGWVAMVHGTQVYLCSSPAVAATSTTFPVFVFRRDTGAAAASTALTIRWVAY